MNKIGDNLKRVRGVTPCPFCGGEEIFTYDYDTPVGKRYAIQCFDCMAGIDPGWAQNAHTVIGMWDRRTDARDNDTRSKNTREAVAADYQSIYEHFMNGVNETAEETAALLAKL